MHLKSAFSPVLSASRISWIFGAAVHHTCEDLINMCQFASSIHSMQPAIRRSVESIRIESEQHALSCFYNKIKLFGDKMNLPKKVNVTNLNFPNNVLDFCCSPKLDVYSFATLIKVQVRVLHFQRFHTNLVFSSGVGFLLKTWHTWEHFLVLAL